MTKEFHIVCNETDFVTCKYTQVLQYFFFFLSELRIILIEKQKLEVLSWKQRLESVFVLFCLFFLFVFFVSFVFCLFF